MKTKHSADLYLYKIEDKELEVVKDKLDQLNILFSIAGGQATLYEDEDEKLYFLIELKENEE